MKIKISDFILVGRILKSQILYKKIFESILKLYGLDFQGCDKIL